MLEVMVKGTIVRALLIVQAFAMATSLQADILNDPTRPATIPESQRSSTVDASKQIWVLETILVAPDRRVAVINGRLVSVGEMVAGARVMKIDKHNVMIQTSDRRITLRLLPDIARKRR